MTKKACARCTADRGTETRSIAIALVSDSSFIYIFQPEPPRDNHDEGHTLMKP